MNPLLSANTAWTPHHFRRRSKCYRPQNRQNPFETQIRFACLIFLFKKVCLFEKVRLFNFDGLCAGRLRLLVVLQTFGEFIEQ